jgi:serine protease inhibitor
MCNMCMCTAAHCQLGTYSLLLMCTAAVLHCRPFLFMLVDDATSTPLFVGTVLDPSK